MVFFFWQGLFLGKFFGRDYFTNWLSAEKNLFFVSPKIRSRGCLILFEDSNQLKVRWNEIFKPPTEKFFC